ncbi:MAG: MFS transporter [Candidatus Nanoarchaeia archaeon]
MKVNVKSNGKDITINVKTPEAKKRERIPEKKEETPDSITEQKELTMKVSKTEGILKSVKTGITTSFTAPFGLALGLNPSLITFLTSIPHLLGALSTLFIDSLIRFARKRKRVMVAASYLESYTWLLVVVLAALAIHSPILLIVLITLDAIFMNIQYPIWNSIMSETVPENRLGKYFGVRNLLVGIASLASMIIAGIILNKVAGINALLGFAIIFSIAFLAAYFASNYQSKMIDPDPLIRRDTKHSFKEFILTIKENNFGRYTWFYATLQMVVNMAAPFFAIYMLEVLKFDYLTFTIITMAAALSSLASMKGWGRLIDRYGSRRIMSITSFLIPGGVLFWLLSTNWIVLTVVEVYSGIIWAGFNLSCSTFMFESVKPEHKVKFYSYNKILYGVGVFSGAMLGVLLYNIQPIIFASSIQVIFLVSGILRLFVALIFIPRIQEEKVVTIDFKGKGFFGHFITLRPRGGATLEAVGHQYYCRVEDAPKNQKTDKIIIKQKEKERKDKIILIKNKEGKIDVKENRNTQGRSEGNTKGLAGNKPGVYNNTGKPPRK